MACTGGGGFDPLSELRELRSQLADLRRDSQTTKIVSDELAAKDKECQAAVKDADEARANARQAVRQNDNLTQMLCAIMGSMEDEHRDAFVKNVPGLSFWWSQHKKLDEAYEALSEIDTEDLDRFFGVVRKRRELEKRLGET